ncbi:MAG: Hsp70 family protein, partial [Actinomycetota bacterium]
QVAETEINLPFVTATPEGPLHLLKTLTRSEFQKMTEDLVESTKGPFQQAVKDAGIKVSDIDHVILVGGSTRMPAIQELVRGLTGKEAHKGVNPDEVVAAGAALQAGVLKGQVKDILLLDVTPLTLGIETLGGVTTRMIERNTTIPTRRSEIFTTASDAQPEVEVHVLQGERQMAGDNKSLGRFNLTGIPPAPRGVPQIEVTFDIDANGIVSVSAKDLGTGKVQQITITGGTALPRDDIDRMVHDAESHADEDRTRREAAEARNQADHVAYQTEKLLQEHGEHLSEGERAELQAKLDDLRAALKETDASAERLRGAADAVVSASQVLGQRIYEASQAQAAPGGDTPGSEEVVEAEIVDDEEGRS